SAGRARPRLLAARQALALVGTLVPIAVDSDGKTEHEVLVFRTSLTPSAFPMSQDGDINEDAPGMNKVSDGDNIAPGGTQKRTVDMTQPGSYVFVCNLPGHFKAGMYQTITVQ